jgi:hypothetical protein
MTEYTKEGLVTDDPQIVVMFYGADIQYKSLAAMRWHEINTWKDFFEHLIRWRQDEYRALIPWPIAREAYQPIQGEGFVTDSERFETWRTLDVKANYRGGCSYCYHKRILNIITTRSELRELVKWAEADQEAEE